MWNDAQRYFHRNCKPLDACGMRKRRNLTLISFQKLQIDIPLMSTLSPGGGPLFPGHVASANPRWGGPLASSAWSPKWTPSKIFHHCRSTCFPRMTNPPSGSAHNVGGRLACCSRPTLANNFLNQVLRPWPILPPGPCSSINGWAHGMIFWRILAQQL